jgi:hypothetical protein
MPEPAKLPTLNTRHFGAEIAPCRCGPTMGEAREVQRVVGSCPSLPPFLYVD